MECIEVSNNLLNSIDTTIDPCEDFYQFTFGNYIVSFFFFFIYILTFFLFVFN